MKKQHQYYLKMLLIKACMVFVVLCIFLVCSSTQAQQPLFKKFDATKDLKSATVLSNIKFKGKTIVTAKSPSGSSNVPAQNRTVRNGKTTEVVAFDGSPSGANEKPAGTAISSESNDAICQNIPVTLTAGFSELNILDPNSIEIWAGRIIRISSIDDGAYSDFRENNTTLTRNPLSVALVAAGTSSQTVRTTIQPQNITQGGVIDAINARKNQFGRSDFGSDTWLYEMYDYTSMDQFAMEAGLGISAVPINLDIRASAGFSTTTKKNKIVLKFFRKAYDVRIDTDISELLPQTATISNDAGVIASVGYGSWGIIEIESDSSVTSMQAALNASFMVDPSVSVNTTLNANMKKVVASFSIRAIFKGISGNQSVMNVQSVDDLRRVLSNNVEQYSATTPVVPVSFTVKSLATGETMMLRSTMTYTKRDCIPLIKPIDMKIKVKMVAFTCPKVNDGVTNDEDIYGKITVDATGTGNVTKFVWDKNMRNLVRVKQSSLPSEGGAYSLNGVANEYGFTMPTDEQSLSNGELWVTIDINDEEWGNPVPYEERTAKLKFKDLFQSIKSNQFRHENFDAGQKLFFIETNEKGNTNKIKLWFRVVQD